MRNIAFIISLTIIFHASYQGFVGTRPDQEENVIEDFAFTEEILYSDSTPPTSPVTEATEVVIEDNFEDRKKDEEEPFETTTEALGLVTFKAVKKRSVDTDEDEVNVEGEIDTDGTFIQDPFPSNVELEETEYVGASSLEENLSSTPRSEETGSHESEQTWRSGQTGNIPYCIPLDKEERGLQTGLGWAAATAILIFAFSNTVIVGATLVISYILYQVVITALAVMAPGVAAVFVKFGSLFHFF